MPPTQPDGPADDPLVDASPGFVWSPGTTTPAPAGVVGGAVVGVRLGVGRGVGRGVAYTVGRGVGAAVGRGVGAGVGVGLGFGVGFGFCVGLASGGTSVAEPPRAAARASALPTSNRLSAEDEEPRVSPPAAKQAIVRPTTERAARMGRSFLAMAERPQGAVRWSGVSVTHPSRRRPVIRPIERSSRPECGIVYAATPRTSARSGIGAGSAWAVVRSARR
jgi:hypothetical protein